MPADVLYDNVHGNMAHVMNCVSNLPNWVLYYLQQTNTRTKVTKTLQINLTEEPNADKCEQPEPDVKIDTPMTQEI